MAPLFAVSPDAQVYAVGAGAFLALMVAFWVVWKVSKFVMKTLVIFLLLGAVASAVWFLLRQ